MSRRRLPGAAPGRARPHRACRVLVAVGAGALLVAAPAASLVAAAPAASAAAPTPSSRAVAAKAAAWLATQQQADGGYEVAGFPGFETPDAVLAIGAAAQTGAEWSARQALAALLADRTPGGRTALDAIDDLADGTAPLGTGSPPSAGAAAKLIALVAGPLCMDPARFDPSGDGATDLQAIVDAAHQPDGTYGAFNATLYAAAAFEAERRQPPADTIAAIRAGRQANGGWNFAGDPSGTDVDPDTTALAVEVLAGTGARADDPDVAAALAFLAANQDASGGWANPSAFSGVNPNSAALAALAVDAAGLDPATRAWRDRFAPGRAGEAYASPDDYIAAQQTPEGRIASPSDEFGVNTFPTTQSIEALGRRALPVVPGGGTCPASGYRLFGAGGDVRSFGAARDAGSASALALSAPIVGGASTPSGLGYVLFAADGGVFAFGDAPFVGSLGDRRLNSPIVGGAVTPSGLGYVLFAADGGVFAFGDAPFLGSLGDLTLNRPIVGGATSATGKGYVLFASDGGIFAFGDIAFAGSAASPPPAGERPFVGGAAL